MPERLKIIKIPFEFTSSFLKGSADGPDILWNHFFKDRERYNPVLNIETDDILQYIQIITIERESWQTNKTTINMIINRLERIVYPEKEFIVTLGGEHTTTLIPVTLLKSLYHDFSIIQFDAHGDLREALYGDPLSHGSVMRRLHEDLELKILGVGIRSISEEEAEYITENQDTIFHITLQDICNNSESIKSLMTTYLKKLSGYIYLTIDFDFFSPWTFPATGTPEPGQSLNSSYFYFIELLDLIFNEKTIIGCDFVEFKPESSFEGNYSLNTASRIVFEVLSRTIYHYF